MKRVIQTLGVARSNVLERRNDARPRRAPQERPGDVELAVAIPPPGRRETDPGLGRGRLYGYRRITAS